MIPRGFSYVFGTLIAVLLIGGPFLFNSYHQGQIRHFCEVRDGILYRSGQLSLDGLKRVVHDYGIKTVITLRDAHYQGDPPPDLAEEEYCVGQEINYYRIPPRKWFSADGSVPAERGVRLFREVMDDPANYPVLIHCFAGIHRTGAFCAVYRMEYEHWSNAQAIAEMEGHGYINLDDEVDVLSYLEHYRPRWAEPAFSAEPSPDTKTPATPVKRTKKRPPKLTQRH
jgi:protein tyrosine/serine phosphatase